MENKQPNPTTRKERKRLNLKTKMSNVLTNKWVHGSIVGVALLTFLVSALLLIIKTSHVGEGDKTLTDYNAYFTDIDYDITLKDLNDEMIGYVISEEMELEDAIQLGDAIRKDNQKEVRLFVYKDTPGMETVPEFYEEGMRYSIRTYPDNHYESLVFYNMPSVEADVESVHKWSLNEKESFVDKNNVLNVVGEVPTMATTEETIAFLQGLNSVVSDLNEDRYENTLYTVKQGLNKFKFSANQPHIIADVELYQMEYVKSN